MALRMVPQDKYKKLYSIFFLLLIACFNYLLANSQFSLLEGAI